MSTGKNGEQCQCGNGHRMTIPKRRAETGKDGISAASPFRLYSIQM